MARTWPRSPVKEPSPWMRPSDGRLIAELCGQFSELWQHASEDLQPEVLLVTVAVGAVLKVTDLVVEPLDEPQSDLVLLVAIHLDPVPVGLDHRGELAEGLQALPLQGVLPVVEEPTGPARALVVPELAERLLEDVGLVQPPIGPEQQPQGPLPLGGEVLPPRQEVVLLPLDEPAVLPREPRVLPLADLIHGLPQVLEDMELVVDDPGLRGVALLERGIAEGLPHVHDGDADLPASLGAEPGEELVQARLGTVLAAEPDRSPPLQVA